MSYLLILPQIILVAVALILPAIDLYTKGKKSILAYLSMGAIIVSLALLSIFIGIIPLEIFDITLPILMFNDMLVIDKFSLFLQMLFGIVSLFVIMASITYIKEDEPNQGEYYTLLLLATTGMMVVAMANDLITLFIGLEITSISSYALVGFRKKSRKSSEAAMKYFIIGALSTSIVLYGISLIYGLAGTTSIPELGTQLMQINHSQNGLLIIATIFLIAGFSFKIAAVPFHMWAPDVYDGAPTTITTFLAAGSKKMGFAALFKVFLVGLIAFKADWSLAIGIMAALTMTVGNLAALKQDNLKRMLAYSSIAQAGYILMALAVATQYALGGGLFHILTHAFMKSGAFIIVAMVAVLGIGTKVSDLRGLRVRLPITAFCMAIMMLSLAGIPPLGGFASKFILFSSAIDAGGWLVWLAVIAVINSAISLYYYARVLKEMYVLPVGVVEKMKEPKAMLIPIVIATLAIIIIGLWPGPFVDAAMDAARALMP